jgi:hypothetical protein
MVSQAIAEGLPKTKLTKIPFRMEMSGFCRHPGSIPVVADIGVVWPILATRVAEELGVDLPFCSCTQSRPEGQAMREWIVANVRAVRRAAMVEGVQAYIKARHGGTA